MKPEKSRIVWRGFKHEHSYMPQWPWEYIIERTPENTKQREANRVRPVYGKAREKFINKYDNQILKQLDAVKKRINYYQNHKGEIFASFLDDINEPESLHAIVLELKDNSFKTHSIANLKTEIDSIHIQFVGKFDKSEKGEEIFRIVLEETAKFANQRKKDITLNANSLKLRKYYEKFGFNFGLYPHSTFGRLYLTKLRNH